MKTYAEINTLNEIHRHYNERMLSLVNLVIK